MSRDILIDSIDADPDQPRRHFDADQLGELAESIAANGLIVPILLRPVGERFVIVHGERRFRACQSLGWSSIPAEVRDLDIESARWMALVENIQRADLTPIEEAQAYAAALATGLTQLQLGKRIGKTQSYIAQKLRLLKMAPEVQSALAAGTVSEGIARQFLRLDATRHDWQKIIASFGEYDFSVREIKNCVDFQLLVWYPQWWAVEATFSDLVEFANRLEKEYADGYSNERQLRRTNLALWYHQNLAQNIWDAGRPDIAKEILKSQSLSTLNEWGKFVARCRDIGIGALTALKGRIALDMMDDARRELDCDNTLNHDDAGAFLSELVKRACDWFDMNMLEETRHERSTDTSIATVPV